MATRIVMTAAFLLAAWATPAQAANEVFDRSCASCHTIGGGDGVGPDLLGVNDRHERDWLIERITAPDRMLAEKDPAAMALLKRYNQIPMPNMGVSKEEAAAILDDIAARGPAPKADAASTAAAPAPARAWGVQRWAFILFIAISLAIFAMFWMVTASTRDPVPKIDMDAAYVLRRVLFFAGTVVVVGSLAATMSRNPYAVESNPDPPDHIVYVTSKQFGFIYTADAVTTEADLAKATPLTPLVIPAGSTVEFRVSSVDVTHGFGIYTPGGDILAQTQAMPGYVNRLRVQFNTPGKYPVLCLEYCGLGHHVMKSEFTVQ